MSTSVSGLSTNFFPSAENGFTTTLASTISSGAATVPLNSVAGYSNGEVAVFVVDPTDAAKKQTFTGVIDTAGVQVTSVVWTAGTNQSHSGGSTVVDYATATHISMMTKGLLAAGITQAGGMGAIAPASITSPGTITAANFVQSGGAAANGWTVGLATPTTTTSNGNRSYTQVFAGTDLTGTISPGFRLKETRTVTAPTQCTDLEASSSQYYSKSSPAGMTFTDDFVVSAWIKAESYATGTIASRYNGTSGWALNFVADGRLQLVGYNAGAANQRNILSYQSVPIGKWVHIAAQLDMSSGTASTTTCYIMIDGLDVPALFGSAGTNPTALIQAGNLEIGAQNGGTAPFDGKLAQVAIYSAKVTQATIRASIPQALVGTETSLISAYSFNNSIVDLNANANNLTANGSAVATSTDSPFASRSELVSGVTAGTTEYGIVMSATFSTDTTLVVQVPEGGAIPTTGGVSAVSYSTQKVPYGFPGDKGKWAISNQYIARMQKGSYVMTTPYALGEQLSIPIGSWKVGYQVMPWSSATSAIRNPVIDLDPTPVSGAYPTTTGATINSKSDFVASMYSAAATDTGGTLSKEAPLNLTVQTIYNLIIKDGGTGTGTNLAFLHDFAKGIIYAECSHI